MHENSRLIFAKYALKYFRPGQKVLEIGPDLGEWKYKTLVDARASGVEYYCADLNNHGVSKFGSAKAFAREVKRHSKRPFYAIKRIWQVLTSRQEVHRISQGLPQWIEFDSEYCMLAPDGSFDVVISGQVIEHVRKPWRWMNEIARVLKKGGCAIIVCPVSWEYHPVPVDCWRIYPEGMRALFDDAGLNTDFAVFESLDSGVIDTFAAGIKR